MRSLVSLITWRFVLAVVLAGFLTSGCGVRSSGPPAAEAVPQLPSAGIAGGFRSLPGNRQLAPFDLTDHLGQRFSRADASNRFAVVSFVFTSCGFTCLQVGRQMEEIQRKTAQQPDVLLLSVTVDPRTDTVRVLSDFAKQFAVNPVSWRFLTGRKADVDALLEASFPERRQPIPGLGRAKNPGTAADSGNYLGLEQIAIVDAAGRVRAYFDGQNSATPAAVNGLLAELRRAQSPTGDASYPAVGRIRAIAADRKTVTIRHEAIPNFMPRMTMNFTVKSPPELEGFASGDEVEFRLHVGEDDHWIDQVRRRGSRPPEAPENIPAPATRAAVSVLKAGDHMPALEFVDEAGRNRTLTDFRGQAVAFTFIFSRCPLPNFCPRMSKHFSRARQLLVAQPQGPTNWQFLSLSFDPEFDSPKVLTRYARTYRADNPDRWLFAAVEPSVLDPLAPQLDFQFSRTDGSFSHNLRTVVLDATGRIHRFFDGSDWRPEELAAALAEAAAKR